MNIVITGASSGLGHAIWCQIEHGFYFDPNQDVRIFNWSIDQGVDIRHKLTLENAARAIDGPVDILINCAGVNGIDYLPDVKEEDWDRIMDTNAKGIFLVTQALLEKLRGGTVCNITSNAAHVPMTSSLAYNCSKASAWIATKQMARELKKTHDITVFGIAPNKLAGTGMSHYIEDRVCALRGWTPEEAKRYQLAALPAGEETNPAVLAEIIAFLLARKERHTFLNGCVLEMGGP